jgi:hypothetical protein
LPGVLRLSFQPEVAVKFVSPKGGDHPYREGAPDVAPLDRPRLWRPWMMRLCQALLVPLAICFYVGIDVVQNTLDDRGRFFNFAAVTFVIACVSLWKQQPGGIRGLLICLYWPVTFPVLGTKRLVRWIARGE